MGVIKLLSKVKKVVALFLIINLFIQIGNYNYYIPNNREKSVINKINLFSIINDNEFKEILLADIVEQITKLYKSKEITKADVYEIINYINIISNKNSNIKNIQYSIKELRKILNIPEKNIKQSKIFKGRKNKNKKRNWINYGKYITYTRVGNIPYAKKSVTKALNRKIENIEEKAAADIETQSGIKFNEIIELISNAIDASTDKKIGKFGTGFQQALKVLLEKKSKRSKIIIRTKFKGSNYVREIRFRNKTGNEEDIEISDDRYKVNKKYKDYSGTRIKVKRHLYEKQKKEIRNYIKKKMKFNTILPIYIKRKNKIKLVNDLENMKFSNREKAAYKENEKCVIARVSEKGYEIEDQGAGMNDKTIYKHLLNPKHSTKNKGKGGENIRYTTNYNSDVKCKVHLILNDVVIEEHEVRGLNLPEELIIDLPANTSLPSSRSEIEINEIIIQALDSLISNIENENNKDCIKILNALIGEIRNLEQRTNITKSIKDELQKLKIKIKEIAKNKKEENAIYLPNIEKMKYVKLPNVSYMDTEICPVESITELKGVERIEKFESNKYSAYTVPMEQIEGAPIIIEIGNIILIDKAVYDKYKDREIDALNILLNFYIGYGEKPQLKGEFVYAKQSKVIKTRDGREKEVLNNGKNKQNSQIEVSTSIEAEQGILLKEREVKKDERKAKIINKNYSLEDLVFENRTKAAKIKKLDKKDVKESRQFVSKEIKTIVESQSLGKESWIRSILRNYIQETKMEQKKEIQINEYMRKEKNKRDKKERVIEIKYNIGMNIERIKNEWLVPDTIIKILDNKRVESFCQKFFEIFKEADVVEIKTGERGKFWELRVRVNKDKDNNVKSINIEYIKEYNGNFKGTEIRQIKEYNKENIILVNKESEDIKHIIRKYCGGLISKEYHMQGEKKKTAKNNENIKMTYNGEKLIQERELLGEVNIKGLGKLRILRNNEGISCVEQNGLYVKEIDENLTKLVPDIIKNKIFKGMENIIIDLPKGIPLINTGNDIREQSKYIMLLQKAIYIAMLRATVYIYFTNSEIVKQYLPEDLYSRAKGPYKIEEKMKELAERINQDNFCWLMEDLPKADNKVMQLITYICIGSNNEISINQVSRKSHSKNLTKKDTEFLSKILKRDVDNARIMLEEKEKLDKEVVKEIPKADDMEKEYIRQFIKWICTKTGIGFNDVEFCYENNCMLANSGYPIYNEKTGQIEWIVKFNEKYLKDYIKFFALSQNLIYDEKNGDSLLETLLHEYAHTIEKRYYLDQILNLLNQNPCEEKYVKRMKKNIQLYFVSLFNKKNPDGSKFGLFVDDLDKKCSNRVFSQIYKLLGNNLDLGVHDSWSHQTDETLEISFARFMKQAMERVIRKGILLDIEKIIKDIKLKSVLFDIKEESIKEKVFNIMKQVIENLGYKDHELSLDLYKSIKTAV
jgi:hypothetical protein